MPTTELIKRKEFKRVAIEAIDADPKNNTSRMFPPSADELTRLKESLREEGQKAPGQIRPNGKDRFLLVIGFQRYTKLKELFQEAKQAGDKEGMEKFRYFLCEITQTDAVKAFWDNLNENLIRSELTTIDKAYAISQIRRVDPSMTNEQIGVKFGKSAQWVAQTEALLQHPKDIRLGIHEGKITPEAALIATELPEEKRNELLRKEVAVVESKRAEIVAREAPKATTPAAKTALTKKVAAVKVTGANVKPALRDNGVAKNRTTREVISDFETLLDAPGATEVQSYLALRMIDYCRGKIGFKALCNTMDESFRTRLAKGA